ncbi:MAG TPA: NfeD family protein [Solirubrobacteraceae bacterium]|jgi:membrane protein implicated in regulation of membrane protease activity|nr:NfeD family protein [Solirubrobacteraceae bacterium]
MDAWVLWLVAAVVLAVAEVLNLSFFLFPFAIGAALAAIVELAGLGTPVAVVVFAVFTALSFGILRPIARRHLRTPPQIRTGTAALIGRPAIVLERIANDEGVGCVRLDGEVWTARAYDDDRVFEVGTRVHVMEIRGATALVDEE